MFPLGYRSGRARGSARIRSPRQGVVNEWPVLTFTAEFKDVGELTADAAVNPDKMQVISDADADVGPEPDGGDGDSTGLART
eukprot:3400377-Pyramimonas_sp.AAC.1